MATPADRPEPQRSVAPAPGSPRRRPRAPRNLLRAARIVAARLRFVVVFAVVGATLGGWETIRGRWRGWMSAPMAEAATSSDTEFFCPMDPGVLSDWPSKCPVCNMSLVRRRRGEAAPLPDGVMARMQFTPYRLALGGIRIEVVAYAPLARTLNLPGVVREVTPAATRVEAEVFARELRWIEPGQAVEVATEAGATPAPGAVLALSGGRGAGPLGTLLVGVEGRAGAFRVDDRVTVRARCPVDRLEPFAGQPTSPPPLGPGEARRLHSCPEHADVIREADGRCPRDGLELMVRPLRADQRVRWWCPMHPAVAADRPGSRCEACGGMVLVPRVVSFRPPGEVLAIPGSAAIDDGAHSYVYVDRGSGMFDARVVTLGPRCGAMVPVASGLEPGDRVVAHGAFLIDAETRLNPSLAAGYFGAGGATRAEPPIGPTSKTSAEEAGLAGSDAADRPRAAEKELCPVTGKALGSMGTPFRMTVRGRAVFLCCAGCAGAVEADPAKFLAGLPPADPGRRP